MRKDRAYPHSMMPDAPPPVPFIEELRSRFDYDADAPLDVREALIRDEGGSALYDVSYAAGPGRRAGGYLVLPPQPQSVAGIIYLHPAPGDRSTFLDEALACAERGAAALLIDAPWAQGEAWGSALGEPEGDCREFVRIAIDLRRGIDLLLSRRIIDPGRIGFVGHSIGALFGGVLSGLEKRVKAYVLMAGTGRFTDVIALNMPSFEKDTLERYRQVMAAVNPIRFVGHAAPAALMFQFGTRGEFFPRYKFLEFAESGSMPKLIRWYDADHFLNEKACRDRIDWLSGRLQMRGEEGRLP